MKSNKNRFMFAEGDFPGRAAQNRKLVKAGLGNEFYRRQKSIVRSWELGTPPPKSLVTGELPVAGIKLKGRRRLEFDRHIMLVVD